jgi:hypothetical protein
VAADHGRKKRLDHFDTLRRMTDSIVAIAVRRQTRTNETGRCAVLYPAIAEAALGRFPFRRCDKRDRCDEP